MHVDIISSRNMDFRPNLPTNHPVKKPMEIVISMSGMFKGLTIVFNIFYRGGWFIDSIT